MQTPALRFGAMNIETLLHNRVRFTYYNNPQNDKALTFNGVYLGDAGYPRFRPAILGELQRKSRGENATGYESPARRNFFSKILLSIVAAKSLASDELKPQLHTILDTLANKRSSDLHIKTKDGKIIGEVEL